ncbi:hypothetical protein C8Q79DRAFT_918319 [Trametes meyenii]|nr:hypothetical protein C8Q79DRAFT_918319 [Trametes meyenii]
MSTTAVVVWQIYYAAGDSESFNVHQLLSSVVEAMVKSRYIGREQDVLTLKSAFKHLGNKVTMKELASRRQEIIHFMRHLVIVINTHADPESGGLQYTPSAVTTLDSMLDHICGDMQLAQFRRSKLFLVCCGGLVRHALPEVRRASDRFDSVFAFGAPMLDPIIISCHFIITILDFNVFGRESLWNTLQRAAKPEVLCHTSVFIGSSGKLLRLRLASLCNHPNGEDVHCCNQVAKYLKTVGNHVKFRCHEPGHEGPRNFRVPLLGNEEGKRWILGAAKKDRYMVDVV